MASPVTFTGLATGLDTSSIVSSLVAAERVPVVTMSAQRGALSTRRGLFQELATRARDLQAKAEALGAARVARAAASSDAARVRASAAPEAAAGVHEVVVTSRATTSRVASQGVAVTTAAGTLGTGALVVRVGTAATSITLAAGQDSLEGLRAAIAASSAGVSAAIVDDGSATGKRLVLTSRVSGAAGAVTLDATGLTGGAAPLATSVLTAAQDAVFSVDGLAMTRPTNTISDAVEGLTLDLLDATPGPVTVTVTTDGAASARPVTDLVSAYDSLVKLIRDRSQAGTPTSASGPLLGDFAASTALSRLRGAVAATAGPATLPNLSALGVKSARDGTLEVDAAKVAQTFVDRPVEAAALVAEAATRLGAVARDLGRETAGTFAARALTLDAAMRDLDARIARKNDQLDRLQETLTLRFSALESLSSRLRSQGAYLAQLASGGGA